MILAITLVAALVAAAPWSPPSLSRTVSTVARDPVAAPAGPELSLLMFHSVPSAAASGVMETGVVAQLTIPWDRIAKRPPLAEGPTRVVTARGFSLSSWLARQVVRATWATSGLGTDDAHLDAMIRRARLSALLPEVRVRAARTDDAREAQSDVTDDTARTSATLGARFYMEGRLTWRLDRLAFADEEPGVERIRLERVELRSRLALRALEALFAWQRAELDARDGDSAEAALRLLEAETTLDVLTGGWFSAWRTPARR
jgi:hypothetical protein